jgi:hypothetical protein
MSQNRISNELLGPPAELLFDPHTERELPNAEAIVEVRICLFIRISAEGLERAEPNFV